MFVCVYATHTQCTLIPGKVIIHQDVSMLRLFFWHQFDMLIKIRIKYLSAVHIHFFFRVVIERAHARTHVYVHFLLLLLLLLVWQCRTSSLHRTMFAIRSIHFGEIPEIFIFRCTIYK